MPVISEEAMREVVRRSVEETTQLQENALELVKRVNIPINSTTPPQLIDAISHDPWSSSGKYALGWVYFCLILLVTTTCVRLWNYWGDRIRIALYKDEIIASARLTATPLTNSTWEPASTQTDDSRQVFFPPAGPLLPRRAKQQSTASAIAPFNNLIALFRYVFYRPIPTIRIGRWQLVTPSLPVLVIIFAGVAFSLLYCFLPTPLFYESMSYGSPPLAIRAGMMSIALVPWIAALASKANVITFLTGIDHERLIVLHRWGAYICFMLAIIHAVPYWWQSVHDPAGFEKFKLYFTQHYYIFTTGISALAPLIFLVVHSLPILRNRFYEFFVILHIPCAWAFIGLLFWHCRNYLSSWAYLYTTIVLMVVSLIARLFYLNWMNPFRPSWLIGEESAVTILPENAVKVTIPTQVRWKPGQYAYLRMPGISVVENHPFTIASLCSEDFPSDYGDNYRNMSLVFRPFSGFTRKVHDMAVKKGPYKTYRSFIEGPYGGMQRQMASFDQVVFFAGGSGITAIASQLLDLVKRMRDGKATTRSVHVIWAMKRPEIMEWFKEELRICREYAPAGSVHCHFFITASKRYDQHAFSSGYTKEGQRFSQVLAEKVDGAMHAVGKQRDSKGMEQLEDSDGYDSVTALPQRKAFASPITAFGGNAQPYFPPPPGHPDAQEKPDKQKKRVSTALTEMPSDAEEMSRADALYNQHRSFAQRMANVQTNDFAIPAESRADGEQEKRLSSFNFSFPAEPTQYQKSLMRFAYLPEMPLPTHQVPPSTEDDDDEITSAPYIVGDMPNIQSMYTAQRMDGWRTEYGRPDIPYMLKNLSQQFSRRACIYVCGPPSMRTDVARTVAGLQSQVWKHPERDEIFLHAENYAI